MPLGFSWPLEKVWEGYLMPDALCLPQCRDCNGYGRTAAYQWVEGIAGLLLMLGEDQRSQQRERPIHPYLRAVQRECVYTSERPGPEALELSTGLAGRAPSFLGHDACDRWSATNKVITAAGMDPETWGRCPICGGEGNIATDEQRAAHEAWERTDPPTGEGWQLWEGVSEGSPVTPVFATPAELVDHLATVGDRPGKVRPMSRAAAAALVGDGWAPSGVIIERAVTVGGETIPVGGVMFTHGDAILAMDADPEATPYRPEGSPGDRELEGDH